MAAVPAGNSTSPTAGTVRIDLGSEAELVSFVDEHTTAFLVQGSLAGSISAPSCSLTLLIVAGRIGSDVSAS